MPATSIDKDLEALTLTLTADYDADTKQVWELWANPRKLERWWGPPTWRILAVEATSAPDSWQPSGMLPESPHA